MIWKSVSLFSASVLSVAAAIILATPAKAQNATPQAGGNLDIATPYVPICWDHQKAQPPTLVLINRNVFDSLVFNALDGSFQPWLAESWDISEDQKSYTFHLRKDVKFSNGEPFNAEAVKKSLDRLTSKDTAATGYAGNFPYAGSTVVEEFTLRLDLAAPHAPTLQVLSSPAAGIVAPATAALPIAETCKGGPALVGTGPFIYDELVPGERYRLVKNPDYRWAPKAFKNQGPAYLDSLTFHFLPEPSVRVGALTSGQVDVALDLTPFDFNTLDASQWNLLTSYNSGTSDTLLLNTSKGIFIDPRVRKALQIGVDLEGLVEAVYGGANARAWSVLTEITPYYDKSLEGSWPFDPEKANALLDEAGWTQRDSEGYRVKDGQRLSGVWVVDSNRQGDLYTPLGEGFQAGARELGFEIRRDVLDAGGASARGAANDYDLWLMLTNRAEADILGSNIFRSDALPPRLSNYARVNDPEIDRLLIEASETVDQAVRSPNYAKVQQWAVETAVAIPLQQRSWLGATKPAVHDITFDIVGFPESYQDTWIEK